jgi:hypothetical protein
VVGQAILPAVGFLAGLHWTRRPDQPAGRSAAARIYRLNRPEDGLKERQIVDRLSAEQQKAEAPPTRER